MEERGDHVAPLRQSSFLRWLARAKPRSAPHERERDGRPPPQCSLSVQGNCSASPATLATDPAISSATARDTPTPLKPFQCRVATDSTVFRLAGGTVWLDNLFLLVHGSAPAAPAARAGGRRIAPCAHLPRAPAPALLELGPTSAERGRGLGWAGEEGLAEAAGADAGEGPAAAEAPRDVTAFLTNVTVQGDDVSDFRVLASAPQGARASVLAQGERFVLCYACCAMHFDACALCGMHTQHKTNIVMPYT